MVDGGEGGVRERWLQSTCSAMTAGHQKPLIRLASPERAPSETTSSSEGSAAAALQLSAL